MNKYKNMLHVDMLTGLKGKDFINYLKRCNPEVSVAVDGILYSIVKKSDSEISFEEQENGTSLTVGELIKELDAYKDSLVLLSGNRGFYINYFENEKENDFLLALTSFDLEELYDYEEPTESEYRILLDKGLASSRVRGVRDDLRLEYGFDDKKVNEAFNQILENPNSLDGIMKDNPTVIDRTIRAFEEFNSLSDRFKEFWMNEFIMKKADKKRMDAFMEHLKFMERFENN